MYFVKRLALTCLATLLLLPCLCPEAGASESGISLTKADYSDVREGDWFYPSVQFVSQNGLMIGTGAGRFSPRNNVTIEQGVILFARLAAKQRGETIPAAEDWFSPYYDYLIHRRLLQETEYRAGTLMTREFFAVLLTRISDETMLEPINEVLFLPDYDTTSSLGQDILKLYNAGIITGIDQIGSFSKERPITRAELAVMMCRFLQPDQRVTFTPRLPSGLTVSAVPLPADEWQGSQISFNGCYIAIKHDTGVTDVYRHTGDLVGKYPQTVVLSEKGDAEIFRTYVSEGAGNAQITYYHQGTAINTEPFYQGSAFAGGVAVVRPSAELRYQVIDTTGKVLFEFALDTADGSFPFYAKISGGYVLLEQANGSASETRLFNCRTGEIVSLPISQFHGFDSRGLALATVQEGDEQYYRYLDQDLQPAGEKYPAYNIYSESEDALNGYFIIADHFISEENRSVFSVTNADFQVLLPAEDDRDLVYANSSGQALFVSIKDNCLYSMDIHTEKATRIWEGVSRQQLWNVASYNEALIACRNAKNGMYHVYDYAGNPIGPACDAVYMGYGPSGRWDSALCQYQDRLVIIQKED